MRPLRIRVPAERMVRRLVALFCCLVVVSSVFESVGAIRASLSRLLRA